MRLLKNLMGLVFLVIFATGLASYMAVRGDDAHLARCQELGITCEHGRSKTLWGQLSERLQAKLRVFGDFVRKL